MKAKLAKWHGQAMADYRADAQEPYNDIKNFHLLPSIFSLVPLELDVTEELSGDVEIENCANTNWPKPPSEGSMAPFLDLVNLLVSDKDERESTQQEDKYAERDKAVDWDHTIVDEAAPRADRSKPHENRNIE